MFFRSGEEERGDFSKPNCEEGWSWAFGMGAGVTFRKAVMSSEDMKLRREARKMIDLGTRFRGGPNKSLYSSWFVLPCSLYLRSPKRLKVQGPNTSWESVPLLSAFLSCYLRAPPLADTHRLWLCPPGPQGMASPLSWADRSEDLVTSHPPLSPRAFSGEIKGTTWFGF